MSDDSLKLLTALLADRVEMLCLRPALDGFIKLSEGPARQPRSARPFGGSPTAKADWSKRCYKDRLDQVPNARARLNTSDDRALSRQNHGRADPHSLAVHLVVSR
jgi:hypothetical protein